MTAQDTLVIDGINWQDQFTGSGKVGEGPLVHLSGVDPYSGYVVQLDREDTAVTFSVERGYFDGVFTHRGQCAHREYFKNQGAYRSGVRSGVWVYRYCFRDELNPKAMVSRLEKYEQGCIVRSVDYHNLIGNVKSAVKNYKAVEDGFGNWTCIPHGEWKEFAANRNPDLIGQYVDGKKDGEWINYNHETLQQREEVETYKAGKAHGPWIQYCQVNNEILKEHNYKDGCRDGYQYDFVCQEEGGRHTHKQANFEKYVDGCMVYREYSYGTDRTIERYKLQKGEGCEDFWPIAHGRWEYYDGETLLKTEIYEEGDLVGVE